jgi:hypothetical protein
MEYIKVKDKDYLERDTFSNGIVNTDIEGYNKYVENYKRNYNSQQKIKSLETDMNSIKDDIDEIKLLLRNLVDGSK